MPYRLADVCDVLSGFTARERLEEDAKGVLTIQMRDVTDSVTVDPALLMKSTFGGAMERYLAGAGDVVFRSRGERNTAAYLDDRFVEPAVAVLPILILRPKAGVVPEYLVWAINRPEAQRHFDSDARGATIRMIPKASIESLELEIPDVATQKKVAKIDALSRREAELAMELMEMRRQLIAYCLQSRIRNAPDNGKRGRK
ncbi:restriction endonuclease subunit S [Rhizobium laguerreae]|uniref:restriction endonuclease subunit S n=1 Tax=Rhizobium laguerreae TaxID=1076926 RepID=UPI00147872A5|nr:restriction endonuclease subunit S [Rhizobium laguerreae]NNH60329.1 restriction endonuclease subunit S [Rhizobium laguerreae]